MIFKYVFSNNSDWSEIEQSNFGVDFGYYWVASFDFHETSGEKQSYIRLSGAIQGKE